MQLHERHFEEFVDGVFAGLSSLGFCKKRNSFLRKNGDCSQFVNIVPTKVRGRNEIHVITCIGFSFDSLNQKIAELQSQKYIKAFPTASIPLETLVSGTWNPIMYIREDTDVSDDIQRTISNIQTHGMSFWKRCETLELFESQLVGNNRTVINSVGSLNKQEWNLLGLAILLNHDCFSVLRQFDDFFSKDLTLAQYETLKMHCQDHLAKGGSL